MVLVQNVSPGFFVCYVDEVPPAFARVAVVSTLLGLEQDDLIRYQYASEIKGGYIVIADAPCGCHSVIVVFEVVSSGE